MAKTGCGSGKRLKQKILFWDLETAGVQGLSADRGFIVCFGYKWLGNKKASCITISDYPGKNIHDDSKLVAVALDIMIKADLLVAHYGDKFDRKYLESRLIKAHLSPLPRTRQVDTCLAARSCLKLSSNRLGNLAEFLEVKTGKMDKRGGWPDWWMGALRGDKTSIHKMAAYCAQDVQCLEECYLRMQAIIPKQFLLHAGLGKSYPACASCGSSILQYRGTYFSAQKAYRRFICATCGKWDHEKKAIELAK